MCAASAAKARAPFVYALLSLGQQGSWLNSCPSMQKVLTVLLQEEEWLHYKKKYAAPHVRVRVQTTRWHAVESSRPLKSAPHPPCTSWADTILAPKLQLWAIHSPEVPTQRKNRMEGLPEQQILIQQVPKLMVKLRRGHLTRKKIVPEVAFG